MGDIFLKKFFPKKIDTIIKRHIFDVLHKMWYNNHDALFYTQVLKGGQVHYE